MDWRKFFCGDWVLAGVIGAISLVAACAPQGSTSTNRSANVAPTQTPAPAAVAVAFPTRTPTLVPIPDRRPNVVDSQHFLELEPFLDEISQSVRPLGLKSGYVHNEWGDQCEYVQHATHRDASSYFFDKYPGSENIMVFSDQKCMTPDVLGMGYLQKQVNVLLAKWYSANSDAAFKTEPRDLSMTRKIRDRGWCMQSAKYPLSSVLIEYFVDEGRLVAVMHTDGIAGCEEG